MDEEEFWAEVVKRLDGRPFTWLARKAGIGQSALSRYYNGSRRLTAEVRQRIETVLDIREEQAA